MNAADLDRDLKSYLGDWRWRMNNLYQCVDDDGKVFQFHLNAAQERLWDEMWYFNLILKARQLGFCLDPTTRVLTADYRWVKIKDLTVGQEIVCVDEHVQEGRGTPRKMRLGTVEGIVRVRREAYRIAFTDGREVICTGQHPWLSRQDTASPTTWHSIEKRQITNVPRRLSVGYQVRSVTVPWGDPTYEDGWFGGIIDGEGSIRQKSGMEVSVAQNEGPILDRMRRYLIERGYTFKEYNEGIRANPAIQRNAPLIKLVLSRMNEIFRLIGTTRPVKGLWPWFDGREPPGKRTDGTGWAEVAEIEPIGERTVIDLQTSHGTYIAEGLVSHNTTFIQLFMLDACLFNSNVRAGTIAHNLESAQVIFRDKVKFPYDHLPDQLKEAVPLVQSNLTEMLLGNNSSIRVGTSMRSGTLQYLHVSEYGKICARYPDKAREVRTGALNTVHAGQLIFIESTAEGQEGHFYEMCQAGQAKLREGAELTPLDFKFTFWPWWGERSYRLDGDPAAIPGDLTRYFEDLEENHGIALDAAQRLWYAKKAELQLEDMKREYPSTQEEAFEASVEGAYYGKQLARAELEGRIGDFPFLRPLLVHTAWDIGRDTTSIWFWQVPPGSKKIGLVAYYQNAGEEMPFYLDLLAEYKKKFGWTYGNHFFPHDLKVIEWGSGKSRIEQAIQGTPGARNGLGVRNVRVVEKQDLDDGIAAVRAILPWCWFNRAETAEGVKGLRAYRKEWDEKLGTWKNRPYHNWASHPADALRTLATIIRQPAAAIETDRPVEERPIGVRGVTLDRLWKDRDRERDRISLGMV